MFTKIVHMQKTYERLKLLKLHDRRATSRGEGVGLPCPFLNKIDLILLKSALIVVKSALFACIVGLNCHLKCRFKSILEKKIPKFFPKGSFFCISYM